MNYSQFFCKECVSWGCDVMADGHCYHPDVDIRMDAHSKACFRLKLRGREKD